MRDWTVEIRRLWRARALLSAAGVLFLGACGGGAGQSTIADPEDGSGGSGMPTTTGSLAIGGSSGAGASAGAGGTTFTSGTTTSGGAGSGGTTTSGGAGSGGTTTSGGAGSGGAAGSAGTNGLGPRPTSPELPEGWSPASEFEPPEGVVGLPSVVLDSAGTAQVIADGNDLWVVPFDASGWGEPFTLYGEYAASGAALAINPQDRAFAIFNLGEDAEGALGTASYELGSGWTLTEALGTVGSDGSEFDIAVSRTGRALAVWLEGEVVRSAYYDGSNWAASVDVGTAGFASLVYPAVGIDDMGRGAALWRASDDGVLVTHCDGAIFDGTSWAEPTRISAEESGCYLPDMAMQGNGDGLAVYEYEYDLHAVRYTVAGGWETGVDISNPVDRAAYGAGAEIAFDGGGNALTVWREEYEEDGPYTPFANRYDASGGWGPAESLATAGPSMAPGAEVALNATGDGIVAWAASEDGYRSVYASRYSPGGGFEAAFLVDAGLNDSGGASLDVDINDAGQIVIVWDRRDDDGAHVFATYFSP